MYCLNLIAPLQRYQANLFHSCLLLDRVGAGLAPLGFSLGILSVNQTN
jgi:hypothetical protein